LTLINHLLKDKAFLGLIQSFNNSIIVKNMKKGKKKKVLVDILIAHKTTYHADYLKKMSVSLILIVSNH
jgi:hypothetical protein